MLLDFGMKVWVNKLHPRHITVVFSCYSTREKPPRMQRMQRNLMQCQIKFISHMEISFLCMSFVLIRDREVCECVSVGQCETPRWLGKSLGKTFDIPN